MIIIGLVDISTNTKVPLYSRQLSTIINDFDAIVTERQLYVNIENKNIETNFVFPSSNRSIFNVRYRIDDQEWVNMIIKEKEEAQKDYDVATHDGLQAFIAKVEKDMYVINIGRMQKNEYVSIEFSYHMFLDINKTTLTFRLPVTLIPPYHSTSTTDVPIMPAFVSDLPYGVNFTGIIKRSSIFTASMYEKDVKHFPESSELVIDKIILAGDKDVVIQITPKNGITSSCNVFKKDGKHYIQAIFANFSSMYAPETKETIETVKTKRFIVIGDGSGSMCDRPIEQSKKAMKLFMQGLRAPSQFCIAMFGSDFKFFDPKSITGAKVPERMIHTEVWCDGCGQHPVVGNRYKCKSCPDFDLCESCMYKNIHNHHIFTLINNSIKDEPCETKADSEWFDYNNDTLTKAQLWIENNVNADYGGTEMHGVLSEAYKKFGNNCSFDNNIIFLTDGAITDNARVIDLIKQNNHVKLYTIGIGHGHDITLIDNMSKFGHGISKHITESDIDESVQFMLNCCIEPHIKNVNIEWNGCVVESCTFKDVVFGNQPLVVFGQLKEDTGFVIVDKGTVIEPRVSFKSDDVIISTIPIAKTCIESDNIDRSFASSYVKFLENSSESKPEKIRRIVELAKQYELVTKFTSAVAVRKIANPDGSISMKTVNIPLKYRDDIGVDVSEGCMSGGGIRGSMMYTSTQCFAPAAVSRRSRMRSMPTDSNCRGMSSYDSEAVPDSGQRQTRGMGAVKSCESFDDDLSISSKHVAVPEPSLYIPDKATIEALIMKQNIDGYWGIEKYSSIISLLNIAVDIIIIDDNDLTLRVLGFFTKHREYNGIWKTSYFKAIEYLTKNKVDFNDKLMMYSL